MPFPVALTYFSLSVINAVTGSKLDKERVCFLSQFSGHTPPLRTLETGTEAGTPEERRSRTGSQVHMDWLPGSHGLAPRFTLSYFSFSSFLKKD